ncbi:hypothetical protein EXIGLDRAFT_784379 [Exidia glandulosa HHB12029]|uniref:Uncharacterized protein n=1 Tax=Exidia glandulosa HHB12029 TaxID=1314781 RepID=A0A166MHL8_EXIGL|nr:hypothetical protein EXIGLDRAFT_784379 [Exidia glandulosa HHB12029]
MAFLLLVPYLQSASVTVRIKVVETTHVFINWLIYAPWFSPQVTREMSVYPSFTVARRGPDSSQRECAAVRWVKRGQRFLKKIHNISSRRRMLSVACQALIP